MTPPPYQGSGGVTDACLVQRAGVIFDGYRLVGVRTGVNQPNDYRERHQELDCKSLTNKALLRFGWVAEWSKAAVLKGKVGCLHNRRFLRETLCFSGFSEIAECRHP